MHELVHILHGHIEYLQAKRQMTLISELFQLQNASSLSVKDLDLQTLELWADATATSVVLGGLLKDADRPLLGDLFSKPAAKVFLWSFALYTLFRIWGMQIDPSKLSGLTHPPTALRFVLALGAGYGDARRLCPQLSRDEYWAAVHRGQAEAERGVRFSGAPALFKEDVRGWRDPLVRAHARALHEHFEKVLVSELRKYAYVELKDPPPLRQ